MKTTFPTFALNLLEYKNYSDEQLCSLYIRKYYKKSLIRASMGNLDSIAIIGKRYETCRKGLHKLRVQRKISEISRETRDNNSANILLTLGKGVS